MRPMQDEEEEMTEPKNAHEDWCNIWTTHRQPCNCKKGKR